jgi:SAM-dependent methyltransferase
MPKEPLIVPERQGRISAASVTPEAVDAFLARTTFTGYQAVPLPHGRLVPGRDWRAAANVILDDRVKGKSVLDVGTYYGFYALEAVRRGASRVVGIEPDPDRAAVAREIAELHGSAYEIHQMWADELRRSDAFDIVLFLNVIHHVGSPVETLRKLARSCRELLIVEFPLLWDHILLNRVLRDRYGTAPAKRMVRASLTRGVGWLLRHASDHFPLAMIDGKRNFYFTPTAFHNLFVVHNRLFSSVEFRTSDPSRRHRMLALCVPNQELRG